MPRVDDGLGKSRISGRLAYRQGSLRIGPVGDCLDAGWIRCRLGVEGD